MITSTFSLGGAESVAQRSGSDALHPEGRRFEPCIAHQNHAQIHFPESYFQTSRPQRFIGGELELDALHSREYHPIRPGPPPSGLVRSKRGFRNQGPSRYVSFPPPAGFNGRQHTMTDGTRRIALLILLAAAVCTARCDGSTTTKTRPSGSTPSTTTLPAMSPTTSPATPTTSPATPTTSPATPAPQPPPTENPPFVAAWQYAAKAADMNACVAPVRAELQQVASTAEYSDLIPIAHAFLACLQPFQAALLQISFPTSMSTQASSLAAALQTEIAELEAFIADPNATTWETAGNAAWAENAAVAALRMALHLPPPPQ